jgi:hypothetical protein
MPWYDDDYTIRLVIIAIALVNASVWALAGVGAFCVARGGL